LELRIAFIFIGGKGVEHPCRTRPRLLSTCFLPHGIGMKLAHTAIVLILLGRLGNAQSPTGSILHIEIENPTIYIADCPDIQLAKSQTPLDRKLGPAFESAFAIADIVSVNGKPALGATYETVLAGLRGSPTPAAGGALVDSAREAVFKWELDFLNTDGTQLGTVDITGMSGGFAPPGAPKEILAGALAVIGGTGAFLGVRGYLQPTDPARDAMPPQRVTSACEDPALRRVFGGGERRHQALYLIPIVQPRITGLFHADSSPVTDAAPAKSGEILTAVATGLGPTAPGVEPGQPFPLDGVQVVNSPVDVTLNGQPAVVMNKSGWPGMKDTYRVDFVVPDRSPTPSVCRDIYGPIRFC
jgi:hypothetical protein